MKRISHREGQLVATVHVCLDPDMTRVYVTTPDDKEMLEFTRELGDHVQGYMYAKACYNVIAARTNGKVASQVETPFRVSYDPDGFPSKSDFPEKITTTEVCQLLVSEVSDKFGVGVPLNQAFREVVARYNLSSADEQLIVKEFTKGEGHNEDVVE